MDLDRDRPRERQDDADDYLLLCAGEERVQDAGCCFLLRRGGKADARWHEKIGPKTAGLERRQCETAERKRREEKSTYDLAQRSW